MKDLETKTQLLSSTLTKLQHSAPCNPGHAKSYADMLASQGLLCENAAATEEALAKWTQVVSQWFQWQLDEVRDDQVCLEPSEAVCRF